MSSADQVSPASNGEMGRHLVFFLICLHVAACCASLGYVVEFYGYALRNSISDQTNLVNSSIMALPFALTAILFSVSKFSFGYVLGFYFYTVIFGYLWLLPFSSLHYDRVVAYASAYGSGLCLLLPILFLTGARPRNALLSVRTFNKIAGGLAIVSILTAFVGALHNFRLVGLSEIYNYRDQLSFPAWLTYLFGSVSNVVLPFLYATLIMQRRIWLALSTLAILFFLYFITLSKLELFAPPWLVFLTILSFCFEQRVAAVLSLLIPISLGIVAAAVVRSGIADHDSLFNYFGLVNFRMVAVPSIGLHFYNDFFSTHEVTYFCQINAVKIVLNCPYEDPLAILMAKAYDFGNFNSSLLATEGVASVGTVFAPLMVFVCGLILALGNYASSGLPGRFILLSSGIVCQTFVNVPLTITTISYGAGFLFLLWYLTPAAALLPQSAARRYAVAP
jgi:hypothetical protein